MSSPPVTEEEEEEAKELFIMSPSEVSRRGVLVVIVECVVIVEGDGDGAGRGILSSSNIVRVDGTLAFKRG
jgi:hypothetical protein